MKGKTRIQKLMRLNTFREERADDALRLANEAQAQSDERHAAAATEMEAIGAWKGASGPGAQIDLTTYAMALQLEQSAMAKTERLRVELGEKEQATAQARHVLADAIRATRVSAERGEREAAALRSAGEKQTFEQTSDVWLNNRDKPRD